MDSGILGVMLTKLTEFASELGQIRAEMAATKTSISDLLQRYNSLELLCRKLERDFVETLGELRGRQSIEDRAKFSLTQVSDQATLVMQNDGQVAVQQDKKGDGK